jgi:nucleoside-diphosphate-sugar epimerase
MRIVITGAGFLGARLARAILARGTLTDARVRVRPVREVVLSTSRPRGSRRPPCQRAGGRPRTRAVERALAADTDAVFHLAAVVSGQAEADFDIGMRVNLDATRHLLERCRRLAAPPIRLCELARVTTKLPDPVEDDAADTAIVYGTRRRSASSSSTT